MESGSIVGFPTGVRGPETRPETPPNTHFGIFDGHKINPFCTFMPSNSVSCHIVDKTEVWGIVSLPKRRTGLGLLAE